MNGYDSLSKMDESVYETNIELTNNQHNLLFDMIDHHNFMESLDVFERDYLRILSDEFIPKISEIDRINLNNIRDKYIQYLKSNHIKK